jgi:hypothetical protein
MERNDKSFEDHERMVLELKVFFFKTLYQRTSAFDFNISSFHFFLSFFLFLSLVYFMRTWVAPLYFLMNLLLLIKNRYDMLRFHTIPLSIRPSPIFDW